jgi:hypothetical protein
MAIEWAFLEKIMYIAAFIISTILGIDKIWNKIKNRRRIKLTINNLKYTAVNNQYFLDYNFLIYNLGKEPISIQRIRLTRKSDEEEKSTNSFPEEKWVGQTKHFRIDGKGIKQISSTIHLEKYIKPLELIISAIDVDGNEVLHNEVTCFLGGSYMHKFPSFGWKRKVRAGWV